MIECLEIEEKDLEQIIDLYETHLNSGEYISDSINTAFFDEDYIGFKACDDGKMIGFFTVREEIGFTYPHPELEKEIRELAGTRKVYTIDAIFMLEEYRGKGIAGKLIHLTRERLLEKKADLVLGELWIYPDGSVPAQAPARGIGKTIYQKKVPMFYSRLKEYGIKCPLCGENCKCGALIELLEVRGDCNEKEDGNET